MSEASKRLGRRIRYLRSVAQPRRSQEELAARAGISPSYLSMLEGGSRSPTVDTLTDLAKALGVSIPSLFFDDSALIGSRGYWKSPPKEHPREELMLLLLSDSLKDWHLVTLLEGAKLFAGAPDVAPDKWKRRRREMDQNSARALKALLEVTRDPAARREIQIAIEQVARGEF